jgi:peptidoglycan/LPS O-acetylase OafA/YrhL
MFGSVGLYLVLATLLPFAAVAPARFAPSPRVLKWSRALGQATFPIYAMHFPFYVSVTALNLLDRNSLVHTALLPAAVVLLALLFAPIADRLKERMRRRDPPAASRTGKLA